MKIPHLKGENWMNNKTIFWILAERLENQKYKKVKDDFDLVRERGKSNYANSKIKYLYNFDINQVQVDIDMSKNLIIKGRKRYTNGLSYNISILVILTLVIIASVVCVIYLPEYKLLAWIIFCASLICSIHFFFSVISIEKYFSYFFTMYYELGEKEELFNEMTSGKLP